MEDKKEKILWKMYRIFGQPRRVSKARSEPSKAQTQPNIIQAETEEEIQPNFRAETETRNPAASPWHRIWQNTRNKARIKAATLR